MSPARSLFNDKGFTLVEVLVSILIMTIALIGLLKSVEIATEQNLKNQMRDEGILVAEAQMNHWRAVPFGMISTAASPTVYRYGPRTVQSKIRGVNKSYTVVRTTIASPDGSVADLGVRVGWAYKNLSTVHEVHTVRSQ